MSGQKYRRTRRPVAEIIRELRHLRSSPLRINDENELWAEGHERPPTPDLPIDSRDQLEQLRLSRHRIGLLLLRPMTFEQAITGCFVRVNINGPGELPNYRIAEILGVGELDYGYKVEDIPTNLTLRLRYEDLVVHHEITDVSNLPFTQEDFELWRDICINQAISPPTTHMVTRKKIELYNAQQCEAKPLSLIQRTFSLALRPPQKCGIMERHGAVYPWKLKHPSPVVPEPPPMPPPGNPPRGLTYRPKHEFLSPDLKEEKEKDTERNLPQKRNLK
ncbi:RNA polymerase-associated protein Rtf1 [Drosophila eugracilis]|uniref:RNA polymerase-associated protein Rtf1 n=1 Tax=Drosophila eugracilis TaxID=29029 RepID=UPI0007E7F39E|nr:RNA polymerase-associated protein Rtf1 [Drosophila eugracilis]